jgi:hypothetical protein
MDRREFLKAGGTLSTVLVFLSSPFKGFINRPIEYAAGGKTYRGTAGGDIYVSEDAGKSWQLHTRLGADYTISNIFSGRDGQIYLIVGYKTHTFHLRLNRDEKCWKAEPMSLATLLNMA